MLTLTAFQYLLEMTTALPRLIIAGIEVHDLIVSTNAKVSAMQSEGRGATDDERDEMRAYIGRLRAGRPDI